MPPKRNTNAKPPPVVVANDSDNQDGFTVEEEILWCIKKLEASLLSENITVKSLKSTVLALKTLKNSKAPFVKKRQVMRLSCGDYRKAMGEDLKKVKVESKKLTLHPVVDVKSGSVINASKSKANDCKFSGEKTTQQPDFCFNFPLPENEELRLDLEQLKIDSSSVL